MITDLDIASYTDEEIRMGEALSWVIGEDVLYDINVNLLHSDIFLNHDAVDDVSSEYPGHDGITVRFYKDGQTLEDFQTSEYFGSILLSDPIVVNLLNHKNGRYVVAPHAKFINYEFIITDRDLATDGWYQGKEPLDGMLAKCYGQCNCGWNPNI